MPRAVPASAVRGPPLVGRERETRALRGLLNKTSSGQGGLALLSGPAGIGKTSLLRSLEEIATREGLRVAWASCLPGVREPFFPLEQAFRIIASSTPGHAPAPATIRPALKRGRSSKETELEDLGREGIAGIIGAISQGIAGISPSPLPLAALVSVRDSGSRFSEAPRRAPGSVLLDYLACLESATRDGGWLIILDDFHWADPESAQGLKFLARNVRGLPVLIVAALREDELLDVGVREAIRDARREGLAVDLELLGLRESQVRNLLETVTGGRLDPEHSRGSVGDLLEWTGGNPYFLLETTRQLLAEGMIRNDGGKTRLLFRPAQAEGESHARAALPVPPTVVELLRTRLGGLPADDQRILEAASLVGQQFPEASLSSLGLGSPSVIRERLRTLSRERHILVESVHETGSFAFAHALLWESAQRMVSPALRRNWSGRLARWFESRASSEAERIGLLYRDAGEPKEGLRWFELALQGAITARGFTQMARVLGEGIQLLRDGGATVLRQAEWALPYLDRMWDLGAGGPLQEPLLLSLLDGGLPAPLRAKLLLRRAEWLSETPAKERERLVEEVASLVARLDKGEQPELRGHLEAVRAGLAWDSGAGPIKARELAERALSILPPREVGPRAEALYWKGWCLSMENRWTEAQQALAQLRQHVHEGGLERLESVTDNLEGLLYLGQGKLQEAEEMFRVAAQRALFKGQSNRTITAALGNQANVQLERGDLATAELTTRRSLRLSETFGLERSVAVDTRILAELRLRAGDASAARKLMDEARRRYSDVGLQGLYPDLQLGYVQIHLLEAKPREALAELEKLPLTQLTEDEAPNWYFLKGLCLQAMGDLTGARTAWETTLHEARERGLSLWEGRARWALAQWPAAGADPAVVRKQRSEALSVLHACGVLAGREAYPVVGLEATSVPAATAVGSSEPGRRGRGMLALELLQHLRKSGGLPGTLRGGAPAPTALTQKGIADGMGIERNLFIKTLSRLVTQGLVTSEPMRVKGSPRQIKVYLLTPLGARVAEERNRDAGKG